MTPFRAALSRRSAATPSRCPGPTPRYTGFTTVSAGSLLVNGSLTSAVVVATGATLGGSGTVGDVTSASGGSGTINPGVGSTDRALTVGSFVLGTGTLFLNLDGTSAYDSVKVTGTTIDLSNTNLTLAITPSAIVGGDKYTILSNPNNDTITGFFNGCRRRGHDHRQRQRSFKISYQGGNSGHDVVLTAQSGGLSILNGFPALNANPHNLPQYAYIAHPGQHSMIRKRRLLVQQFRLRCRVKRLHDQRTRDPPASAEATSRLMFPILS